MERIQAAADRSAERAAQRSIPLRFPTVAYVRLGAASVAFVYLMYGAYRWVPGLALGRGEYLQLEELYRPSLLVVAVATSLFAGLLLWLRQPRGARVTWDDEGITEWDGQGVRSAIQWANARRSSVDFFVRRRGSYSRSIPAGCVEQFSDAEGRRITLVATKQSTPRFLQRRRCHADAPIPVTAQPGQGVVDDGTWRRPRWWNWPLRAGYALTGAAAWALRDGKNPRDIALVFVVAAGLLLCRAIPPVAELLRTWRVERAFQGAQRVELVGNVGPLLDVRDANRQLATVDTTALEHPDALLHSRRGAAFLRFAPPSPGSPYREGKVLIEAHALELVGSRLARRDLQRALLAEVAARLLVVLTVLGPALLIFSAR